MAATLSLRDRVAVAAVRATNSLSRRLNKGSGTVIGGRVGLLLSPHLLRSLARSRTVIVVSGTNGKTTTTAMTAAGWGGDVTTNETGSNMAAGHVASLAFAVGERTVLEVDEAWLDRVLDPLAPRVVVLLNLSRDQLDRATEVRALAARWRAALGARRDVVVVANANDPLVVYGAQTAADVRWCDVPTPWTSDAVSCPHCTQRITFGASTWSCRCGFAKPDVVTATLGDRLVLNGVSHDVHLGLPGTFNRSNAAMALTALSAAGVEATTALPRIAALTSVAGRFSVREWRGQRLRLLLAKNPAGFGAMLDSFAPDGRDIWVAINARLADGVDPSWLYDVPFEQLEGHHVYCFGERRLDLATRLYYAGVEATVVEATTTLPPTGTTIDLLANYTAFHDWLESSRAC